MKKVGFTEIYLTAEELECGRAPLCHLALLTTRRREPRRPYSRLDFTVKDGNGG